MNKTSGRGKRPGGSGRGKATDKEPARKASPSGGRASASRPKPERQASAKKAAQKRKRKAPSNASQT